VQSVVGSSVSMVESKQFSQLVYMGITAATRFVPLAGKLFRRVVDLGRILELRRGEPPGALLLESRRLGVTETPVRIPHTCN
jgi:hypothetical protein